MKSNILIGVMAFVWLVLMANIIWQGTEEKWYIEDAEKIGQLEVAKYTNQIIVVAVTDDGATLCLYEKASVTDENVNCVTGVGEEDEAMYKMQEGTWSMVFETEAMIGRNGLGKKKEGDGKTPVGVFCFTKAFGILENPGTKMEYTQVDESHYWVDDSSSNYYNQFISIDEVEPDWKSAEHICEYEGSYYYVLAINYNSDRIPGVGSAVFLHCTSENVEATAGCIAIPDIYMREIVKRVKSQCIVIIDESRNILRY
ncbi:MAG: L,D-transpeptidase family protein [Agathobacter sp.]|nr:L,D-transpeptidase family protein [Agathobacter sp.]